MIEAAETAQLAGSEAMVLQHRPLIHSTNSAADRG
jgi:hypothetical protein